MALINNPKKKSFLAANDSVTGGIGNLLIQHKDSTKLTGYKVELFLNFFFAPYSEYFTHTTAASIMSQSPVKPATIRNLLEDLLTYLRVLFKEDGREHVLCCYQNHSRQ